MALYAIADLHLSLAADKPMDVFLGWQNYVERLEKNWRALVTDADTVVVAGDISWGMTLEQAGEDFAFLNALPGRKLLLKGNHDYWWSTRKKMEDFFAAQGFTTLELVHNNAVAVENRIAVCGTRGWFTDAEAEEKVLLREAGRLNASIDAAQAIGLEPVVFLHYPPAFGGTVCTELMHVLTARGIRRCYYGHIHGAGARTARSEVVDGVTLRLISCDALSFTPLLIRTMENAV